jgi:hypothetical protein
MAFEAGRETGPVSLFTRARTPTVGLPNGVAAKLLSVQELAEAAHRQMPLFEERHEANTARGDAQRAWIGCSLINRITAFTWTQATRA